jgi:hypothetical protein
MRVKNKNAKLCGKTISNTAIRVILQVLFVFILSSFNNDVTIKIIIDLVINHYWILIKL